MVVVGTIGLGALPPLATFCRFFGTRPLKTYEMVIVDMITNQADKQKNLEGYAIQKVQDKQFGAALVRFSQSLLSVFLKSNVLIKILN